MSGEHGYERTWDFRAPSGRSHASPLAGHAWEKLAPGLDPRAGCYPDGRKEPGSNVGIQRSLWLGVKTDADHGGECHAMLKRGPT